MKRQACPMCHGTDTQYECERGQCYAEHMQQQETEDRRSEDWERGHDQFYGTDQ